MSLSLTITQARLTSVIFTVSGNHYTIAISYDLLATDIRGNAVTLTSKSFSVTYNNSTPVADLVSKAVLIKADILSFWGSSVDTVLIGGQAY